MSWCLRIAQRGRSTSSRRRCGRCGAVAGKPSSTKPRPNNSGPLIRNATMLTDRYWVAALLGLVLNGPPCLAQSAARDGARDGARDAAQVRDELRALVVEYTEA